MPSGKVAAPEQKGWGVCGGRGMKGDLVQWGQQGQGRDKQRLHYPGCSVYGLAWASWSCRGLSYGSFLTSQCEGFMSQGSRRMLVRMGAQKLGASQ